MTKLLADLANLERLIAKGDEWNAHKHGLKILRTHHAEIAQAVRDAAMLEWSIDHARWLVHEHEAYVAVPVKRDADLSSKGMRRQAIDDAMRGGVE